MKQMFLTYNLITLLPLIC